MYARHALRDNSRKGTLHCVDVVRRLRDLARSRVTSNNNTYNNGWKRESRRASRIKKVENSPREKYIVTGNKKKRKKKEENTASI